MILQNTIFVLIGITSVIADDLRTYVYSDEREFTVVFSDSDVEHIATTTKTIVDSSTTRTRTFLTYTGTGARPTGSVSSAEGDENPQSDEEDVWSSEDEGMIVEWDPEENEVQTSSTVPETVTETEASLSSTSSAISIDTISEGDGSVRGLNIGIFLLWMAIGLL